MKLSTRARYGLRAMVQLARTPEGATGRSIAENQYLPTAYLEQLMARLRNAKLVISIRGAKGKFVLARSADTIHLDEIIQALDGPIEIADCADIPHCGFNPEVCALRRVYRGANNVLLDYLAGICLADLAIQQQQQDHAEVNDFCI